MLILAVYRKDIFRFCQSNHQFLLVLAGMTGNVYVVHLFINHFRSQTKQFVYHTIDKLFVARNRTGGNDDKIVRRYFYLSVFAHRHAA